MRGWVGALRGWVGALRGWVGALVNWCVVGLCLDGGCAGSLLIQSCYGLRELSLGSACGGVDVC